MLRAEVVLAVGGLDLSVSVEVTAGRCLALTGPSGAGKTTLLRLIAGVAKADRGRISCGEDVWSDTEHAIHRPPERRRCAYVSQDYALFPHLSAWRNVAYGLREVPRRERRQLALEMLERFGLAQRANVRPGTLSGGERQRVALARALIRKPSALLLDEPLSALDARTRAIASREIATVLGETDIPTMLVTHDFADAALLGDEVAVIDHGRIIQRGAATDLAAEPRSAFVASLTGAVVLNGVARPAADGLTSVALDGGGEVKATAPASGPVAVSIYPWEIVIEPPRAPAVGSAQNHLLAEVVSVTTVGNRVRVGLHASQPLVAEVTQTSARSLGLAVGSQVSASWKATATRLIER
jgi:molybdate transport system ATP-binding protein